MPDTLNADVRFRLDLAEVGPVTIRQTGYEHTAGSNHSGWAVGSIDLSGWLLRRYGVELPAGESIYIGLNADMTLRPADGTPAGAWASDAPSNIWVGVGRTALAADTTTANILAKITADTAAFRGGSLVGTGEEWSQGALASGHGTATGWHGTNPEGGTPLRWQWSYYSANAPGRYVTLPDTSFIVNVLVSSAANWVAAGVTQMDLTLAGTVEITVQRFVTEVQSSISPAAANELAALTAAVQAGYETVGAEAAGSAISAGASTSASVIAGPDIQTGRIYELRTGGGSAVIIDGADIAALTPSAAPARGAPIDLRGRSHHLQVWRTGAGYVAEDVILGRTAANKLLAQWEVPQALAAVRYVELARRTVGAEITGRLAEIVDDLRAVEAVQRAADYTTTLHGSPISITARAGDDGSNFTALTAYQIPDSTVRPAQPLDVNVTGYHPVQIEIADLGMTTVQARGTTDWGPRDGQADVTLYYRAYPLYEADGHTRHGEMWVGTISTDPDADPDPLTLVVSFTVAGTYDGVQVASKDLISRGTDGAGLTQSQVDGRVRALVEAWARVGGGDVPSGRIDAAVTSLVADQIGRRAVDEIEAVFAAVFAAADTTPAAVTAGPPGAGGPLGHALAGSSKITANTWLSLTMGAGYDVRRHIDADHVLELSAKAVAGQALTDSNSIEYHAERKGLPTGLRVRLGAAADGTPVIGYSAAGSYAGVRVAAEAASGAGLDIEARIADWADSNSSTASPLGRLIATSATIPTSGHTALGRLRTARWTVADTAPAGVSASGDTVSVPPAAWGELLGVVYVVKSGGIELDRAYVSRPGLGQSVTDDGTRVNVHKPMLVATGGSSRIYTRVSAANTGVTALRLISGQTTMPSGITVEIYAWVAGRNIGGGELSVRGPVIATATVPAATGIAGPLDPIRNRRTDVVWSASSPATAGVAPRAGQTYTLSVDSSAVNPLEGIMGIIAEVKVAGTVTDRGYYLSPWRSQSLVDVPSTAVAGGAAVGAVTGGLTLVGSANVNVPDSRQSWIDTGIDLPADYATSLFAVSFGGEHVAAQIFHGSDLPTNARSGLGATRDASTSLPFYLQSGSTAAPHFWLLGTDSNRNLFAVSDDASLDATPLRIWKIAPVATTAAAAGTVDPAAVAPQLYRPLALGTDRASAIALTFAANFALGQQWIRLAAFGTIPASTTVEVRWLQVSGGAGGGSGGGLTTAQVDARVRALVAAQAIAADTSRWPAGKIPTAADLADELDALSGADRLSYRSLRDAPPPAPPGEIDADAVQIIVDRNLSPVVIDVAEISDELDETSALAAARWDSTETPWQTIHPYPAPGIAKRVDGAVIARGGFHRLWIADYGADGVALVDDTAVLGHATTSPDAQLGEVNGLAVLLTDTDGAGTGETAYIGHGADGAAYISFERSDDGDITNNSYGNPWRVRLEALTPAAGPVASDDTLTGDGTARSPLAVSTHAALPPPGLALGSRGEVLRRLNVTEAEMADDDLAQIDDLLDTVREYLTAHMGAASLTTRRVRTAAVWMTAMAYQLRAQGIGEVDLAGMAQTQEIADMLRGLREVSL